jgi:glutathione S-transferase
MADLIVYGVPLSPFVRKVQAVLHAKELKYELEAVNIMSMPDWFLDISPARRIPVLRYTREGTEGRAGTIPDSSAICAFLDKLAPSPALYPQDPFECGRAVWLEEYADSELAATVGMGAFRPVLFPRFQGQESDVATVRTTMTEKMPRLFDYLESVLDGGSFLVGDGLTIADVAVGVQLANLELVVGAPDSDRWPALAAHLSSMKELEGFKVNLQACGRMLAKVLPEPVSID